MTAKGVARYRKANPGSKLKTAVTGKVKKGLTARDAKLVEKVIVREVQVS
jgi:hypothetical protein